jgi:hypothetical protein
MFLPWALPVTVERDLWDWYLYAASLCAAITAIVLFLPWALERRRRPEVRIDWALSLDGDPAKLENWPADYVPQIIRVRRSTSGSRSTTSAIEPAKPHSPTSSFLPALTCAGTLTLKPNRALLGASPLVFRRTTGSPTSPSNSNHGPPATRSYTPTGSPTRPAATRMSRSAHDCCSTSRTAVSTAVGDAGYRVFFRLSNSATRTPASHGRRGLGGHDPSGFTLNPAVGWPVHEATVETSATSLCSRHRKHWLHRGARAACSITPGSHASSTQQPMHYPERGEPPGSDHERATLDTSDSFVKSGVE